MKSAILIIDMQRALFESTPEPYEAHKVIERINLITGQARKAGIPVIFTQYEHAGFLDCGSNGWKLHTDLAIAESDIRIRKTTADPFLSSNLDALLREMQVTDLIVCGYASEICVDTTIRRASGLGYAIQLVSDAHTTQDKEHLSAKMIREHHNITLSMGPTTTAIPHDRIELIK